MRILANSIKNGTALWLTVAMLIGAFVASWCATLDGKLPDGVAGVSHR